MGNEESIDSGSDRLNSRFGSRSKPAMTLGIQPIDALMVRLGLRNHDLVVLAAGSGLTHKQVAKARRGRRLTRRIQKKIVEAINRAPGISSPIRHEDCFTYDGDEISSTLFNKERETA